MADEVKGFVPDDDVSFGPDYEASVSPDVPEFYGAKINLFYSEREFRIAFGSAYGHRAKDGPLHVEPRYKVAIYMPVQTAMELCIQLGQALKSVAEASGAKFPDMPDGVGAEAE